MIWQKEGLGLSNQGIARNLGVDPSTIGRVFSLFKATGSVQKRCYPIDARPNRKLTKMVELAILHTTLRLPGIYLCEVRMEVSLLTRADVSVSSLCTFLHDSNLPTKGCSLYSTIKSCMTCSKLMYPCTSLTS